MPHKTNATLSQKRALSADARWSAIVARDRAFDGQFLVCVSTTGIYCRPTCPARTPLRKNVCFHETCTDAEAAGFRACKRCKPNEPTRDAQFAVRISAACRFIEAAEVEPTLSALATNAGLSPFHFHRSFKQVTGLTPKAYAIAHRLKRVRQNLRQNITVTDVILNSGFNSNGRFYANSAKALGMTPSAYKSGGVAEKINFAIAECSLGSILVAATTKGVCAILLGDDPNKLLRDLQDRFTHAQLTGGDKSFDALTAKVIAYVERPADRFDLPLDVRGTAFQHKVWMALCDIPSGSTAKYADIAKRIGKPSSVRAVAGACAANPVAVAIPCHRVVRTDGAPSGYRWGIDRKRTLLEREAQSKAKPG